MIRSKGWLAAALVLLSAADASAQRVGIGGRAGTLGLGGEALLGSSRVAVRGGFGVLPFELSSSYSDIDYTIDPPESIATIGVDLFPTGGAFRLSGGLLFRKDWKLTATSTATYDIGGRQYNGSQIGAIEGEIKNASTAPYATLGFYNAGRVGFSFDVGVAFMGDTELSLRATQSNAITQSSQFRQDLERERAEAEDDIGTYLKFHPIASFAITIGF